jgi:hypothetical protein
MASRGWRRGERAQWKEARESDDEKSDKGRSQVGLLSINWRASPHSPHPEVPSTSISCANLSLPTPSPVSPFFFCGDAELFMEEGKDEDKEEVPVVLGALPLRLTLTVISLTSERALAAELCSGEGEKWRQR